MNQRQHVTSLLKWTRSIHDQMLKDIPPDKATFQPSPTENHVIWVVAHSAMTDHWIATTVGASGTTSPEAWKPLCGSGSKPTSDPKVYPKLAEVRKVYDENRAAVLNWIEGAPDAAFATPLKEKTGGFADTTLDALYKLVWHEGWHFGQVANVRKALGLPPVM